MTCWLKLGSEKIRREQVGTVPTFFCLREQSRQVQNRFDILPTHSLMLFCVFFVLVGGCFYDSRHLCVVVGGVLCENKLSSILNW